MIRSLAIPARRALAIGLVVAAAPLGGHAQIPVTRADAERATLSAGPRVALARADTAVARAALVTAKQLPNPLLALQLTGAPPQRHIIMDVPLDVPWIRGPRVRAANALSRAWQLRFVSERAAALLDVDTTYSRALGAQARFRLSRQTARDADSLRKMAVARRDAGDASDLDVDLATVTAGQQLNIAARDSLSYMSTVLIVQTLMGIPADSVAIVLVDSLRLGPVATGVLLRQADSAGVAAAAGAAMTPPSGVSTNRPMPGTTMDPSLVGRTPSVAAAEANLQAAELAITREHRSVFNIPSLQVGTEWYDPTVGPVETKKHGVIGLALPLPFFNRNQGAIAQASAERDRARGELTAARLTARQRLVEALRELASLRARVARDQELVLRGDRVAAKSLEAYREGASALPAVLEARRIAREVLGQYIDDLTALITLQAELRVLTQTVPPQ